MNQKKFNNAVGTYLRNTRKSLGLTYKQVEELTGRSKDWYREIERGRNSVKFNDMIDLCDALGIDMADLKEYAIKKAKEG